MTLRVWDFETGQCLKTLEGHTNAVHSVSIVPDGKRAVSGSKDITLRVWDVETGQCLKTLEGHTRQVHSVSITPDGKSAVSGSWDLTLRVWDLESGQCLKTLEGKTYWDNSVSVTPDGRNAVSGSEDRTLRVWGVESGQCLKTLEGHTEEVSSVSITPDGKRAVSGSWDKTLRVWDLESGQCLKTLEGHRDYVNSVSVTPDGKRAVSGSKDNTLRVWDLESGQCVAHYQARGPVTSNSKIRASGQFAYGTSVGELILLIPRNLLMEPPIVTPIRFWLHSKKGKIGQWDKAIKTLCPWCGKQFSVADKVLDVITAINRKTNLHPGQSPCLELPFKTWEEPRLRSECPLCHKLLNFNPFIVDNRDHFKVPAEESIPQPGAHPATDPPRASRLNIRYQKQLQEWKALPWWKRLKEKKPKPPTGI